MSWRDSSAHHHDHPLFFHDFNFLNPSSHTNREDSKREHHHVHTLKAGRHVFPFSLTVPGSLPASLRTYSGTGIIEYKLKAIAQRPGFTAADWKSRKIVRVSRSFGADAVEFNQTLEIGASPRPFPSLSMELHSHAVVRAENTWPGKVMYSFTLPHKAFAAGDTIPVAVKFSPLAKGIRIVSLITTIREHTTVYSKNSSHSEARDATVVKYNFGEDTGSHAPSATASGTSTPAPRIESSASLSSMGVMTPTTPGFATPGFSTPFHGGARTPAGDSPAAGFPFDRPARTGRRARFQLGAEDEDEAEDPATPHPMNAALPDEPEVDDGQDTEVDVVVDVQIPIWTAPSHSVHPVFVNHKIKWSAFIKNPDGHVSELRCALPIHILASCLQEEARLASAGSRNLLFGASGALAHSALPQVDLPSYQDHVMDRVANAETAGYFSASSGFAPTPWSSRNTPTGTPGVSPPASRPPSRPASPDRRSSHHGTSFGGLGGFSALSSLSHSHNASRRSSGAATPATASPPPERAEHPEDHRNWIDSELLGSLNVNGGDGGSPAHSTPSSRPGSRPSSRPSSRAGSRASSPDRGARSDAGSSAIPMSPMTPGGATAAAEERPSLSRSHNSSFFNLHFPKPLRPLTAFSRNSSSNNLRDALHLSHHGGAGAGGSGSAGHGSDRGRGGSSTPSELPSGAPSPSALSSALAAHAARAGPSGQVPRPPLQIDTPPSSSLTHTHPLMSNSAGASPVSASPATAASPGHATQSPQNGFRQVYGSHTVPAPLLSPSLGGGGSQPPTPGSATPGSTGALEPVDFLSQVPSYDVAARGFLGGGITPLSFNPPGYDDAVSTSSGGDRSSVHEGGASATGAGPSALSPNEGRSTDFA